MNPCELNAFIERVYHAGPENRNARDEILAFSQSPDALSSIVRAIEENALSRISLLVALSMIPHTKLSRTDDMTNLREWFRSFVLAQAHRLSTDRELLAMVESVFMFSFEGAARDGATFIQQLSVGTPPQRLLAVRVSKLIIDDVQTKNVIYLIPVAVESLKDRDCSGELVEACFQLLLSVLSKKESQHEHMLKIVNLLCGEVGIHNIVSFIYRCGEIVESKILTCLAEIVSFPLSAFPNDSVRDDIIQSVMSEVSTLIKKRAVHASGFQSLASLCVAVRKAVDWREKSIVGKFVEQIGHLTEILLDPVNLDASSAPAEYILDFWCDKSNWGYRTGTVWSLGAQEKAFVGKLLGIFQKLFFGPESLANESLILKILSDESSNLADKIAKISELDCDAYAAMVFESLWKFTEMKSVVNAAFCIEFFSHAIRHNTDLHPRVPEIMSAVNGVITSFPPLGGTMYSEPNIVLEMALLNLFSSLSQCFLSQPIAAMFIKHNSEVILAFYIRFLSDIQCPNAPINLVNRVMEMLRFDSISPKHLELLASDSRVFDLISTSQVIRSDTCQSKSETKLFFSALFMLGYATPDPTRAISLVNAIERTFNENHSPDVFAMLSGCFLPANCPFCFMFDGVAEKFFGQFIELLASNSQSVVVPLLTLLLDITKTPAFSEMPVMCSKFVSSFSKILELLKAAKDAIGNLEKASEVYLKSVVCLMNVLSSLVKCKSLNIGLLSLYYRDGKDSLFSVIFSCFDLLLLLPFPLYLEQTSVLNAYKEFIVTLFTEDASIIVGLSDVILQHQLFLFAHLLQQDQASFIEVGCDLVTAMLSGSAPDQLENLIERQNSHPINTIASQVFTCVFTRGLKCSALVRTLRCIYRYLPDQYNAMTESLMTHFSADDQPQIRLNFEYLRSKLELQEATPAEYAVKDALRKIVSFAKEKAVEMSL